MQNIKIEIIAEIAQGYEGSPMLAEMLVKGAIATNADAVKIQIIIADELCTPDYPYYKFFKSLEMKEEAWEKLVAHAHLAGCKIYFDVYGPESAHLALKLKADGVKISTADFYNIRLRDQVLKSFDRVYLSIGGIPIEDIDSYLKTSTNGKNVVLMHGFQAEPTPVNENNLSRISALRDRYPSNIIGFMDHSDGGGELAFEIPILAVGFGARVIEKHITLDRVLKIEDYTSALSADHFLKFVKKVRAIEESIGSNSFNPTAAEIDYKTRAGKIIVASCDIMSGAEINLTNTCLKRVSTKTIIGSIAQEKMVLGKRVNKDIPLNAPILQEHIV